MKYSIQEITDKGYYLLQDNKTKIVYARFYFKTIAQKVCDLLNETSRSQGKWPK